MLVGTFALAASAAMIAAIDSEPMSVAAWRCLLACPMLLPFALWELRRVDRAAALPRRTLLGAVIGGIAIGADYAFYNTSIVVIGAASPPCSSTSSWWFCRCWHGQSKAYGPCARCCGSFR
ncbi:hypothetical protein [Nesterenkonia pannonica]|uniref:hypothetical protein n=1 Tax=Nesterenkonia pannonica TaxID=1548602 RepID=UPI0021645969|nr:hypothetical protein [Nesterenkonia pannonica]